MPRKVYSKYENRRVVEVKNFRLVREEQEQIVRRMGLWVLLLEEVLRVRLDEGFEEYFLVRELDFVTELIPKLLTR